MMKRRHVWPARLPALALVLGASLVGCTDDTKGSAPENEAGTDGSVSADAGANDARVDLDADAGRNDAAPIDARATDDAATLVDAAPPGDSALTEDANSTHDAAADTGALGGVGAPTLTSAVARQVGRFGGDLRIEVGVLRGERTVVAVQVELFNGQHVSLGAPSTVALHALIEGSTGDSYALFAAIFERYAEVSTVRIALVDELGALSDAQEKAVERQPVLDSGACDDTFVLNRCATGLGCREPAPKSCLPGVAPALSRLGYYVDSLGPRIIFDGSDGDADVVSYRMQFFDANDAPVAINHDSEDSTPPVTETTGTIAAQTDTSFFVRLLPSDVLIQEVTGVRVSVLDSADRPSNVLLATRSEAPTRGLGATCDEHTFNQCSDGGTCTDFGDQHRCASPSEAQASACLASLVLNPGGGVTRVRGSLRSSLWDAPPGCSMAINQDDSVVKLVLNDQASRVVLSTDHPYTGFDSVLYLLSSCSAQPTLARCNADQSMPLDAQAVLTVLNLPAGEYYVVVDSFPSPEDTSDTFELTVSLE